MTKSLLEERYTAARSVLLLVAAFSAVNVLLALFGVSWNIVLTAFFPYFNAVAAPKVGYGVYYLLCALLPIIVLAALWYLSKKSLVCFALADLLFLADTAYLVAFVVRYGLNDASFVINGILHLYVLFELTRGAICGIKLKRGKYLAPISDGGKKHADN